MRMRAKALDDSSITKDPSHSNLYQYRKRDKSDPDQFKLSPNKYQLWSFPNTMYKDFDYICCNCYSYYKSYVCKHAVKLADKFGLKLKGYSKVEVFAVNAKRGAKKKPKTNPLQDE